MRYGSVDTYGKYYGASTFAGNVADKHHRPLSPLYWY